MAHKNGADGVGLIAQERLRQACSEGWSIEHDDEHTEGELAVAASCYALPKGRRVMRVHRINTSPRSDGTKVTIPEIWPWDAKWWKPTPDDRIRELAKAGALIAAEIDRLQRLKKV